MLRATDEIDIKDFIRFALKEERKRLAEKIRNFVDKEIHKASSTGDVLDRLSDFIESEDS